MTQRQTYPLRLFCKRLGYLRDVGLDYLSLDRTSRSLSGGETQRINLTCMPWGWFDGYLFALDEPTIGLHHQDVGRLIGIFRTWRKWKFVCVVEHDDQVIRAADRVIEIGPNLGLAGGHITFEGTVPQFLRSAKSETGKWLAGKVFFRIPQK
jgi:excinuclease ABC subunit A